GWTNPRPRTGSGPTEAPRFVLHFAKRSARAADPGRPPGHCSALTELIDETQPFHACNRRTRSALRREEGPGDPDPVGVWALGYGEQPDPAPSDQTGPISGEDVWLGAR